MFSVTEKMFNVGGLIEILNENGVTWFQYLLSLIGYLVSLREYFTSLYGNLVSLNGHVLTLYGHLVSL